MELLIRAASAEPAEWIVEALRTFAWAVTSLVPAGFPAYARIFHPAYDGERLVRWSEVAAANGAVAHAEMQFGALLGDVEATHPEAQPGVFDRHPVHGELPRELVPAVVSSLRPWTTAPHGCWFAVWEGWGGIDPDVVGAPTFELPHRRYHLLGGPLEAALESVAPPPVTQTASLWWPDDRAWCVATEVDLDSTYVGCSRACLDALLAEPTLEVFEIDPAAGIAYDTDRINRR